MATPLQAVVLAAGRSTRFGTPLSKLLTSVCGQPMIAYPAHILQELSLPATFVLGHQDSLVKEEINQYNKQELFSFVLQQEQKGTGHALLCSQKTWQAQTLLIMNGDMPLVTTHLIQEILANHRSSGATVTFAAAYNIDPSIQNYGRVITDGTITAIVEAKDFTGDKEASCLINAGIYVIERSFLEQNVQKLDTNNNAKEFYLTDLIKIACQANLTVAMVEVPFDQIRGVNTLKELWIAEQLKRNELLEQFINRGVRFLAPASVIIETGVTIQPGSVIGQGVHLLGATTIGQNCTVESFSIIKNSHLADQVTIYSHSVVEDATVNSYAKVGPFAHLRNHALLEQHTTIGNFVEVKNSTFGAHSKAKHLTFLGDTTVGQRVNIGAGTITCNYDGATKHRTTIGDNAFVGSNNTLVAPLVIENSSYTAAGSTITQTVPANSLAIGRARQVVKNPYCRKATPDKNTSTPILPISQSGDL